MNILEIIEKKRDNKELSKEEIEYFIKGYTDGTVTDYQAAALIMAIYINGMTEKETTYLTISMANSGDILDLSKFGKNVVDKHSTGGVGDKVSLILLPIIASLDIPVAKMSGRGLGFTGGTADKLEAIPGYNTMLDINSFVKNVENIGISMITQTMNLAPADKKIYSLRDSISCVESIPLITSSIMSKKIASGANKIVLDVTVGSGAFMKTTEDAIKLSNAMIKIGKLANRETVCILTNMEEPLGYAVGNTLEVIEAVKFLKGDMPEDVNGKAYEKFLQLVKNQNGDISYIENLEKFKKAKYIVPVYSTKKGFVQEINAEKIGILACRLGAGRVKKEDNIQQEVGIVLNKKISDKVNENDILAYIHSNDKNNIENAKKQISDIFKISQNKIDKPQTVIKVIKD